MISKGLRPFRPVSVLRLGELTILNLQLSFKRSSLLKKLSSDLEKVKKVMPAPFSSVKAIADRYRMFDVIHRLRDVTTSIVTPMHKDMILYNLKNAPIHGVKEPKRAVRVAIDRLSFMSLLEACCFAHLEEYPSASHALSKST